MLDRTFQTLGLALLGVVAFAQIKPSSPEPIENVRARETAFYIDKAHQRSQFDGVIIGDSRALRGVSTEALADELPNLRIYNFAFNSAGLGDLLYREGEKLLDPASSAQFVVLAPTTLTFQPWKRANEMFHEYRNKARDQVWLYQNLPTLAEHLQPLSPSIYIRRAYDIRPAKLLEQDFRPDGWIATRQMPVDDPSELAKHREYLAGNVIDPVLVQEMMSQTRAWTARGIRVFAFAPPADRTRLAMEDSVLGFDWQGFRESFVAAGGRWLEVSASDLKTYDGSHLDADSARRMSRILAREIAKAW